MSALHEHVFAVCLPRGHKACVCAVRSASRYVFHKMRPLRAECHKAKNFTPGKEAASTKARPRCAQHNQSWGSSWAERKCLWGAAVTCTACAWQVAITVLARQLFVCCNVAHGTAVKRIGFARQVATTVLAIQERLPQARVVYCSATGVSEASPALHQRPHTSVLLLLCYCCCFACFACLRLAPQKPHGVDGHQHIIAHADQHRVWHRARPVGIGTADGQ